MCLCVSVRVNDVAVDKQITSVKTDSGNYVLTASVSEGPHYHNYYQDVIVKVRDSLGSITEYKCGTIQVSHLFSFLLLIISFLSILLSPFYLLFF